MTYSSYRVKVPGKLLIAGEYAVLEPNQQAVVIAVNRYITAYIEPSSKNQLSLLQLGLDHITWETSDRTVQFNVSDSRLDFIRNSIMVVNQFLQEHSIMVHPFHLTIKSELNDPATGRKYGLGSSAAVVVAAISSMLMLHSAPDAPPTLEQIFKLSAIAHLKTQKNGSGVDIAASTYGGWIVYSPFNHSWVLNKLNRGASLKELVDEAWPNLSIEPLKFSPRLKLAVGWTKEEASTAPMVRKIQKFWKVHPEAYMRFLTGSSNAVTHLIESVRGNNAKGVISSLLENRRALLELSEYAGVTIETPKMKELCALAEPFGGGKSSGAGGGDCGFAFIMESDKIEMLYKVWQDHHIIPLKLGVSKNGAAVTEYNCEPSLMDHFC